VSLVLYQHPFASYCQKALIALYELDLPFRAHLVDDADARAELAATLWPMASIPVLRDEAADLTLPESTPMQKIVGDSLRREGRNDPEGVVEARSSLDTAYTVLDAQVADRMWATRATFTMADCAAAPALFYTRAVHRWDEEGEPNVTRYYRDLMARPSVARVVDEARPWRGIFPLPWPAAIDALDPVRR
jgi:glutathione S-transferase